MPENAPTSDPPGMKTDPRTVWASYGHGSDGETEDFLVGSRAGLLRLKEHIEIAIESGESLIADDMGLQFNGVRRLDIEKDPPPESWKSSLLGWGCLALLVATLALAVIGLKSLLGY